MKEVKAPFELGIFKLHNCPFCNTEPDMYGEDTEDRSLIASIQCGYCPCKMDAYLAYGSREAPSLKKLEELIESWNTRI